MPVWAFTDARCAEGFASIAVVHYSDDVKTITTKMIETSDSSVAEAFGISLAREMYGDIQVFNDNHGVCVALGATWIPRDQNRIAHRAAASAYRKFFAPIESTAKISKKVRRRGVRGARGRGILIAGEQNRFLV